MLYERHREPLARFLFNKAGDDAADLLQKTFLAALTQAGSYRGEGSLRAWLFGIAYRVFCQHLRDQRGDAFQDDISTVAAQTTTPGTLLARQERHRRLLEALRQLPVAFQAVLELHYWEDMTNREIADALELPLGTVQTRIRRARHSLAKLLAQTDHAPVRTELEIDAWAIRVREELQTG